MIKNMTVYGLVAFVIVLIGAFDLGIYGLIRVDLISSIFGEMLGRLIFVIIGAAAGYLCYLIYVEKMKKMP